MPRFKRLGDRQSISLSAACILALALTFTSGCGKVERDFKAALQTNTEQAFQEFIKQHPDGLYAAKVRVILDKVAVQKLDADHATDHKRTADKVAADHSVVLELAAKEVPTKSNVYIDGGGHLVIESDVKDEAGVAKLEADREQAGTRLVADERALDRLEAGYVTAHQQALAKLETDKRLVSDAEFLSHLGDQYGTNTVNPTNAQR